MAVCQYFLLQYLISKNFTNLSMLSITPTSIILSFKIPISSIYYIVPFLLPSRMPYTYWVLFLIEILHWGGRLKWYMEIVNGSSIRSDYFFDCHYEFWKVMNYCTWWGVSFLGVQVLFVDVAGKLVTTARHSVFMSILTNVLKDVIIWEKVIILCRVWFFFEDFETITWGWACLVIISF